MAESLTIEEAKAFVRDYEKKEDERLSNELMEWLKTNNRTLDAIVTIENNEVIRKQIVLIKST